MIKIVKYKGYTVTLEIMDGTSDEDINSLEYTVPKAAEYYTDTGAKIRQAYDLYKCLEYFFDTGACDWVESFEVK